MVASPDPRRGMGRVVAPPRRMDHELLITAYLLRNGKPPSTAAWRTVQPAVLPPYVTTSHSDANAIRLQVREWAHG